MGYGGIFITAVHFGLRWGPRPPSPSYVPGSKNLPGGTTSGDVV